MKKRKNYVELPEDCWALILNSLSYDGRHYNFISLVCRQFLHITNQLHRKLTITEEVIPLLPSLIRRFPNLKEISICDYEGNLNLNLLLCQISQGLIYLGSKILSSLRIFNCKRISFLKDDDLVAIANMFPSLEELGISYYQINKDLDTQHSSSETNISDSGVLQLSLHLTKLHKIKLSGNKFLTDQSIISLSSNCSFLRELVIDDCNFTTKGIGTALREFRHLDSISICISRDDALSADELFAKSFAYAVNLSELHLCVSFMTDEFLGILAEARLPLKKLIMADCYGFTYVGISNLLQNYGSLVYLDVQGTYFLTDETVVEISMFLKHITYINLSSCSELTSSAFFALVRNCPFLSSIKMSETNLGIEGFEIDFAVNYQVKNLQFSKNTNVCDEFLRKMALACPNIQDLILRDCGGITVEGINDVLRNCHEIKHLDISSCKSITEFNIDIQLPNLEVLGVLCMVFDHKSLQIIRERCPRIPDLFLGDCTVYWKSDGVMVKIE